MSIKLPFLFAFLLFISSHTLAQPETIASDRPGNANTPVTVGKGIFQGQHGIDFNEEKYSNSMFNSYALTNVLRFGLSNKTEINSEFDYRTNYFKDLIINDRDVVSDGISKLSIGVRHNFIEENQNKPAIGILANVYLNGILNDYRNSNPDGRLLILAQKTLFNFISLTANMGIVFDQNFNSIPFVYTLNLSKNLSSNLSTYIEIYGSHYNEQFRDMYFDTGVGYLLNKNIQLDLYGGFLTRPKTDNNLEHSYFISTGLSFRI